jgi:hypothetical protein
VEWLTLAQTVPSPPDLPLWAQWGLLGFVVLGFMTRRLVPGWTYDREAERADRLEIENSRLRDRVETKVLPLIHEAIHALQERDPTAARRLAEDTDR